MIEVISSILEAEKKADEILNVSNETSKKIKEDGDVNAEKIKNDAVALQRIHQKAVILEAERKAEEEYSAIIVKGEEEAKAIINGVHNKVEKISKEILAELLK